MFCARRCAPSQASFQPTRRVPNRLRCIAARAPRHYRIIHILMITKRNTDTIYTSRYERTHAVLVYVAEYKATEKGTKKMSRNFYWLGRDVRTRPTLLQSAPHKLQSRHVRPPIVSYTFMFKRVFTHLYCNYCICVVRTAHQVMALY